MDSLDLSSIVNSVGNRKAISRVLSFGLIMSRWCRVMTGRNQLILIEGDGGLEILGHRNVLFGQIVKSSSTTARQVSSFNTHLQKTSCLFQILY